MDYIYSNNLIKPEEVYIKNHFVENFTYNWEEQTKTLILSFSEELSLNDKIKLDDIISLYNIQKSQIFKLNNNKSLPKDLDFNLFGLHKEEIFDNKGSLIIVNYYKDYNNNIYSDLVVQDNFKYTISNNDLVQSRVETIYWYYLDNSIGHVKIITKYYELIDGINEGIRRRTNLINKAKEYGLCNILGTHSSGMLNSFYFMMITANYINLFIQGVKDPLIAFIMNSSEPYITTEIKNNLVNIVKYW